MIERFCKQFPLTIKTESYENASKRQGIIPENEAEQRLRALTRELMDGEIDKETYDSIYQASRRKKVKLDRVLTICGFMSIPLCLPKVLR